METARRLQDLHHWLTRILGETDYQLHAVSGDASFRRYFRVRHHTATYIVMDAPPEREDCALFIDIAKRLAAAGIDVPEIITQDAMRGFVLLTDLGDTLYLDHLNEDTADALYARAMRTLARLQQHTDQRDMPPYNKAALLAEMALFRQWLLETDRGLQLTAAAAAMLDETFDFLAERALGQPKVFVHRDYHSRNLMVVANDRIGVLDFQDAVVGPYTYDLVSLLKDCYIKWDQRRILRWARDFAEQFAASIADVDTEQFMRWFDLMGVQRHLKASGIFARLHHRDGKSSYLADIPRTLSYIVDLDGMYPELQDLIAFIQETLPRLVAGEAG